MKRHLASFALIVVAAALSGCYYDPGYSYVRSSGQGGDAYYGRGESTYYAAPGYDDGYYGNGYYGNAYYGSGYYGCCYGPAVNIGIGSGYYGGPRYRSYDDRGGRGHDDRDRHDRGGHHGYTPYRGRPSSNHPQGDRQPRSGGSHRDEDH